MIELVQVAGKSYDVRVKNAVLARIWYAEPLFKRKNRPYWVARSVFKHESGKSFGGNYHTVTEAYTAMEDMINNLANLIKG